MYEIKTDEDQINDYPTEIAQQRDIENIDPDAGEVELEPIDIEQVQKIQAELPASDPNAPVGSNKNPIRIIQQGNQYITTQDVASDHLEQIIQVLTNEALLTGGRIKPSAIYNKNTNKRIVFRVIKRKRKKLGEKNGQMKRRGFASRESLSDFAKRKKRQRRESSQSEDPDFEPDVPEEEVLSFPVSRKKSLSGRISKPPRHFMKDYKHLKRSEYRSSRRDASDSELGYSDYEGISDDNQRSARSKDFPCDICGFEFATRHGLARHRVCKHPEFGDVLSYHVGRYTKEQTIAIRRRRKLQDALAYATDDDLVELLAPRISKLVSPWEYLLMRSEEGDIPVPQIPSLVIDFTSLVEQARTFLKAHLISENSSVAKKHKPAPRSVKRQRQASESDDLGGNELEDDFQPCILKIETEEHSSTLELPIGRYIVQQSLDEDLLPDRFKAMLDIQRNMVAKEPELRATINKRPYSGIGYEDESPESKRYSGLLKRGRGRPPGSTTKKMPMPASRKAIDKTHDSDKLQSAENSDDPQVLQRVHDPTLNDDLLFMAEGGIGHPVPEEWLQSGAYMAVLTESGDASDLVMEASTGKLFHKPTGHLVQLAGAGTAVDESQTDEQQEQVEEPVNGRKQEHIEEPTVVIDESTGQMVDVEATFPGVSVTNISPGVCIVAKANGARFQVEHGGQGLTLDTLQTVLEMDDQA